MRSIATAGVAWSVGLSVCFVTFVNPAKTAEPIEMPFAGQTRVGHVLAVQTAT